MLRLSIIIPVYNVEQYISKCIESVINSTFQDYELILVDDGSTDESGEICDVYAAKDNRIKVIHQENGGVSYARNIGMNNSSADWITFIDSDDYVSPTYIERLFEAVEAYPEADYIHAGCTLFGDNHETSIEYEYENLYSADKNILFSEFRGLPFAKLFRKEIIIKYHIVFDEHLKAQEDLLFNLDYIIHVNAYVFMSMYEYYHRTDNMSSIMHTSYRVSYDYALCAAAHFYDGVNDFIQKYSVIPCCAAKRQNHVADALSFAIFTLYLSRDFSFRERLLHIRRDFSRGQISYLQYCSGKRNRLLFAILRLGQCYLFNIVMSILYSRRK